MRRFIWLVIAFICVLFTSGCEGVLFPLPYRSLAPFEGKVVDADTKQPVEGAVVLGIYYYETYSIAGSSSHLKDGQETMTDKNVMGDVHAEIALAMHILHERPPLWRK